MCIPPGFPLSVGNNVLIVAHASSLEACTRQLQGRSPQSAKDFIQVVRKVRSHTFLHLVHLFYFLLYIPPFCPSITASVWLSSLLSSGPFVQKQGCVHCTEEKTVKAVFLWRVYRESDNNKLWTGHFWNHVMNRHESYCLTRFQFK